MYHKADFRIHGHKYKRCFCPSWKDKFLWLQYKDGCMYCTYCLETNKHNSYTSGCQNFRTSDIQKHSKSRDHRSATEAYAMKLSGATVPAGFYRLTTEHEQAIVSAMRNVYWLSKEDVASLKYNSLNKLVELQGCECIRNLYVGENAKYTSPEVVKEMQEVLSQCIKSDIRDEIQKSPYFSIMIDESTDVSTTKALIVYAHLLVDGVRKTRFLADVKLGDCDAVSIEGALEGVLEDYGLNYNSCFGFSSDGASVMTGHENGVAALIKRKNSYLISVHCAAHRLALASSQAADKVEVIAQYQKSLSIIYSYFCHSCVHTEQLAAIQRVLEDPEIRIKRLYQVRWLSFDIAVDAVLRSLQSLMMFFEHAANKGDPTAVGIHSCITTYKFLGLTHLIKDNSQRSSFELA